MNIELKMPQLDIENIDKELLECNVTKWRVYSEVFTFEGLPHQVMLDMVNEDDYAQMILYLETPSKTEKGIFQLEEIFFTEPRFENISEEWKLHGKEDILTVTIVPREAA